MIKAVFFDWFNTLVCFEPPRHELYHQAFREFGVELALKDIMRGILTADHQYFVENAKSPVRDRSQEEQLEVFCIYPRAILAEAGVDAPSELPLKVMKSLMQPFSKARYVLFEDVQSTLKTLKEQRLTLGLLTNAAKNTVSIYRELGLQPYLDFVVTSEEARADKPNPAIFLLALERAGVGASEAVHVGDQYNIDIVGARGVGINPVLIDRFDLFPEISDCPRIRSLTELAQYL